MSQSEGEINWKSDANVLDLTEWHQLYTLSAPYLELIEEFTLQESIDFHFSLKPKLKNSSIEKALKGFWPRPSLSKQIANFSSGMKPKA